MASGFSVSFKKFFGICLFVLLLFTAGYFIQYGREAANSGSWQFVINHDDEWSYWLYAQGYAQAREYGINPLYYEDRYSPYLLPYPTAQIIGGLARFFSVPVLFFFPIWHIVAPFLVWFALFWSAYYFWRYPLKPAAFVSLILCLMTLHLKGSCPYILTRFSRPADFLWLAIFWISFVMNLKSERPFRLVVFNLVAMTSLWMSPMLAMTALVVMVLEMLWQMLAKKEKRKFPWFASMIISFFISCIFYFVTFQNLKNTTKSYWLSGDWAQTFYRLLPHSYVQDFFSASLLFTCVVIVVFGMRRLKEGKVFAPPGKKWIASLSALDRLVLYVFLIQPLISVLVLILNNGLSFEITMHRYVNFLIQLAVLTAWIWEAAGFLVNQSTFRKKCDLLLWFLGVLSFAVVFFFKNHFLLLGSLKSLNDFFTDPSFQFLCLLCPLGFVALLVRKYERLRVYFQKPFIMILVALFLGVTGFLYFPSQLDFSNKNFPFGGAYEWLAKNAKANDVVLTASSLYSRVDYLPLHTRLRSYFNEYAFWLSKDMRAAIFRRDFWELLLFKADLNQIPLDGKATLAEKIRFLKLDYILVPQAGPFRDVMTEQVKACFKEVYQDKDSVLWKVKV